MGLVAKTPMAAPAMTTAMTTKVMTTRVARDELGRSLGTGDVGVMNLVGASGNKQDQLALVPEPMTLILLGTGLIGVGIFRRKMK